ncbi:hypothetical protein BZM27_06335 [Paraburkholderia steynii]|uniref:Uncharacterized protein n=1 Tax=Paraburkholderia steynii TaxID=1245441 RepID=A0A4R0XM80_9BURK|nr:hypothetical protein BZM27_06335 [Paraburkholderia steynii]
MNAAPTGMEKTMTQPLLGILPSLDSLFESFQFQIDTPEHHVLLTGLPGTVRSGSFLFARPGPDVREPVAARCTNGIIGGFRAIRSAHWMKQGLLPVYAYDLPHIVSFFAALIPYAEHERFESKGRVGQ